MTVLCPSCKKPAVPAFKLFCSARCKQIDLGRWFAEQYAVPVAEPEETEDDQGVEQLKN
jgi:uncharacterized protein